MSKKRPTESSWDSDEELLSDTSGIAAFPKTSELDLMGDDGELDEDALLGMDEQGAKAVSVSFANDSIRPLAGRQRSKTALVHQPEPAVQQEPVVDEQAFVFEETDTADLEDELNVGGQETDSSAYHEGASDGYASNLYHAGGGGDATDELSAHHQQGNYTAEGLPSGDSGDIVYMDSHSEQAEYGDGGDGVYDESSAQVSYTGEEEDETQGDNSGVELGYEQPEEQDEQVHLEYEDSHASDQQDVTEGRRAVQMDSGHYESESDSDDENSRHSRGKFTSERTGVISLTPATTRETIPDTLEINDEQAAQIEQFMSDKTQRGKGKARGQGRPSAHSRLGSRPGVGPQQGLLQGPRMGPGPRGMLGPPPRMGFPFPGGPPNRSSFPGRMMGPRGPFPGRFMNQRGPFPVGPLNQRGPFPVGPRGPFPRGAPQMAPGVPQRGSFPLNQQGRFLGPKGPFPAGPPLPGPLRGPQLNMRGPQPGPAQMRGPLANHQVRPQGVFQQRGPPSAQMGQRPQQMGQQGASGPRPLMGLNAPGMRLSASRPSVSTLQGQPIPSLVRPVATPQQQGGQRPGQPQLLRQPTPNRISPHQRLGPVQGQNRLQGPPNPMARAGGPPVGPPMSQGYPLSLMGSQGAGQLVRKHKIYINPRFQGPQSTVTGITRTVKLGVPVQQQKAKALLEKAKQTQIIKQIAPTQTTALLAGVKRKSTGGDDPPTKVVRVSDGESTRVVQTQQEPMDAESRRLKALLEEQQRKRELIQKRKELARQRQAAIKRKELEERLKAEGKSIEDILGGGGDTESTMNQEQVTPTVRQISGSVASRLGPPPTQRSIRGPVPQQQPPHAGIGSPRMRPPGPQGPPAQRPQPFQSPHQQFQNIQARAAAPSHQPRMVSPQELKMRGPPPAGDLRLRGPPPAGDLRMRGPPPTGNLRLSGPPPTGDPRVRVPAPTNDPRFQGMPVNVQFRGPPPSPDTRFRAPPPSPDPRLRGPQPNIDHQFRGPPPMSSPRLQVPPPQTNVQTTPVPGQPVRYIGPPPGPQLVRIQAPRSAPPQGPPPLHFAPQYPPSSAPAAPSPHHYPTPSPSQPVPYTPATTQYAAQTTTYQPPSYPPPSHQHYHQQQQQPAAPQPSPGSQHYAQAPTIHYQKPPTPQYELTASSQYLTPATTHYPPSTQFSIPSASQYQSPSSHYQSPTASVYQSQPAAHYQSPPGSQRVSTSQSYGTPTELHQQQQHHDYNYYSDPQPIQTITHQQVATPSPVQDQRTVQHHPPVGQRIQTIGQRVQPVTGTQMRSIIHNVVSPRPSPAPMSSAARLVQSRTAGASGGKLGADGQAQVMDGPQKILIQNVPQVATKETLIKICRHFGQVLGVTLMREQNKAVVQFQRGEQAAKCVAKCDQKCLHKTRLSVKLLPS